MKRRRGAKGQEKKKQATEFKEAVDCSSAVVEGTA